MNAKTIIGIILVFLLGFCAGWGYGLSDNGTSIEPVRSNIRDSQERQRTITSEIRESGEILDRAGDLIEEGQYILRRVRSQPAG